MFYCPRHLSVGSLSLRFNVQSAGTRARGLHPCSARNKTGTFFEPNWKCPHSWFFQNWFNPGRGLVTVAAIEIRDANNAKLRVTGLSFTVKEAEPSAKEKISFVDYDEIDSLLKAIEYISGADHNITRLANFVANYKTKGDFSVATYGTATGIHLAVSSGTCSKITAHFETTELTQLKSLIENGKIALDSAQQDSR